MEPGEAGYEHMMCWISPKTSNDAFCDPRNQLQLKFMQSTNKKVFRNNLNIFP